MKGRIRLKLSERFKRQEETEDRPVLPVKQTDAEVGLTHEEVAERVQKGYMNLSVDPPAKTIKQIVLSNLFTYFNLIFFILAACIIAVGSWRNLMFMPVILANICIGIVQEIRAKQTLDKLSLLQAQRGIAIRNGAEEMLPTDQMVRDDMVVFQTGDQVFADAVVASGEVHANEALITGEADEIKKLPGDELLSGSFIINGTCRARLTQVGADSYAAKLTLEAKKNTRKKQSEMMLSLSRLVKYIGIVLLPFGLALGYKEIYMLDRSLEGGVVSTVGALVGMIPEGLYLLTSLALAAGILRLAQKKTLVHDMNCIETLARVDVLCVDKTGTITENKMIVEDIALLCEERYIESDIRLIMSDYVGALGAENDTMDALKRYFQGEIHQEAVEKLPFSSAKKYGGVSFHTDETYLLGAPDILLGDAYDAYKEKIESYSKKGCRVLLLALYDGLLTDDALDGALLPLSLILLGNKIRPEAPDTFQYFADQNVEVKVISGDNPITVSEVSQRAKIANAERYVDARGLDTDEKLEAAATKYTVFGRVTPEQKRKLVTALKKANHTVAMTGDGVNDVLALKEADCGIAMASGSDVACRTSHIVLLDSNFGSMPWVVMEGRRVINNIERAASLFLVKNIFSFLLALVSLFFTLPYPVTPAQLSLVSTLTIGIPSFILAMEPNSNLISGRFLSNVIYRALPAALTNLFLVMGVLLFYIGFDINTDEMSTICAIVMGAVGLLMLVKTCRPMNLIRKILILAMVLAFVFSILFFRHLFTLSNLSFPSILVLTVFTLLAYPVMHVLTLAQEKVKEFWNTKLSKKRKISASVS